MPSAAADRYERWSCGGNGSSSQPRRTFVEGRHGATHVVERVAGVGVGQDGDRRRPAARAPPGPPGDVVLGRVAEAQLHGAIPLRDVAGRLVGERRRLLPAEQDAARIGRHRLRGPAEQAIERPAGRLAADVPQRDVEAAQRHRGGRAHAVAGELHLIDALPHADHVEGVHAEGEVAERGVDQLGDGPWAAAVMGLAPAGNALVGLHLHQNGVTLDGAAAAERHVLALRHLVGDRECLDRADAHVAASDSNVSVSDSRD